MLLSDFNSANVRMPAQGAHNDSGCLLCASTNSGLSECYNRILRKHQLLTLQMYVCLCKRHTTTADASHAQRTSADAS